MRLAIPHTIDQAFNSWRLFLARFWLQAWAIIFMYVAGWNHNNFFGIIAFIIGAVPLFLEVED